jgi:2-oxo-4-hydroxy-4-carboxy--5-ureidoimidazoline (OHCU) decarboxylase
MTSLAEVNQLSSDAFVAQFGGIVECSPHIAQAVHESRSGDWASTGDVVSAFSSALDALDEEGKAGILNSHPDLVGRAALEGTLTKESTGEQKAAGLGRCWHRLICCFDCCCMSAVSCFESLTFILPSIAPAGDLSEEERAKFAENNESYRTKFGITFVICARENKKDAILAGFEKRLQNSRSNELLAGIGEVKKIVALRLADAISE